MRAPATKIKPTGWFHTDSKMFCSCPRCNAQPGEDCKTPKGRKSSTVHTERTVAYAKIADMALYRVRVSRDVFVQDLES
jgi:hypothetical protein